MVILSDSQQPTTPARPLINHHGCCNAIKKSGVLINRHWRNLTELLKSGILDSKIALKSGNRFYNFLRNGGI